MGLMGGSLSYGIDGQGSLVPFILGLHPPPLLPVFFIATRLRPAKREGGLGVDGSLEESSLLCSADLPWPVRRVCISS